MTRFEMLRDEARKYIETNTGETVESVDIYKEMEEQIYTFCAVFATKTRKIRVTETFGNGCYRKYITYFDVSDPKKSIRLRKKV